MDIANKLKEYIEKYNIDLEQFESLASDIDKKYIELLKLQVKKLINDEIEIEDYKEELVKQQKELAFIQESSVANIKLYKDKCQKIKEYIALVNNNIEFTHNRINSLSVVIENTIVSILYLDIESLEYYIEGAKVNE